MVSASSLAHFNSTSSDNTLETVEIDPQYAEGLGFKKGDVVCAIIIFLSFVAHTSKVEVVVGLSALHASTSCQGVDLRARGGDPRERNPKAPNQPIGD